MLLNMFYILFRSQQAMAGGEWRPTGQPVRPMPPSWSFQTGNTK